MTRSTHILSALLAFSGVLGTAAAEISENPEAPVRPCHSLKPAARPAVDCSPSATFLKSVLGSM